MTTSTAFAEAAAPPVVAAPLPARVSWVLFDWAVQPFYTLIVTFLFAPYFANAVVGDPVRGQEYWGYGAAAAGVLVALGSPLLGAMADGRGRRKPWIALFSVVLACAMGSLWFATPGASMSAILLVLFAFVVATAAAEFTAVFTNAIMPSLVPHDQLGRLSGTGWAMGYFGGLAALILVGVFLIPAPGSTQTLLGLDPLLSLDAAARENDRLSGPFSAVWYLVFMMPFFLFVPDGRPPARPADGRPATAELLDTIRGLPSHPDMLFFLIARMIYSDGLSAIFAFGGIYGAAVFGWGPLELVLFAMILTLTGGIGALLGGFLDDRLGPKTVILGALVILIAGAAGILSVDKTHVFYIVEAAEKIAGAAPFSSTGEWVFLAFGIVVATVSAPVQAASRSLLARLAPPEKITQYFGLFAFSGKATAFLAPFLVATVTTATGDQRLGMAAILVFLLAGMALLMPVRAPKD